MNYDVAVLLLNTEEDDERETDNDYIRSICLPEKTEIIDERQLCHVTGKTQLKKSPVELGQF